MNEIEPISEIVDAIDRRRTISRLQYFERTCSMGPLFCMPLSYVTAVTASTGDFGRALQCVTPIRSCRATSRRRDHLGRGRR